MSRPQPRHAAPTWRAVALGGVVLGMLMAMPAQAQVYASAPADDEAAPLVLSNFASDDAPLLLIDAPKASAPAPLAPNAPLAASPIPTPAPTDASDPLRASVAPGVPATLLPWFQHVGREQALPASLLMAVAAVESGFNPRARSPKGAQGLMQLMPATARQMGVRQVWSIGDNLRGGASYLRSLLQRYAGDLALALAAYNAGEGAVQRAGNRIPDIEETRLYVPKVIAWQRHYAARHEPPVRPLRTASAAADRPGTRSP